MKKLGLIFSIVMLALVCSAPSALAQGNAKNGPDQTTVRDPEMEKDAMHNLEVARLYFKLKKAYRAAIGRCEEIIAGNPNFSRLDEVLYIAGESSYLLSMNKGKQAANLPADKLREDARDYLSRLVKDFPDSSFRKQAESRLKNLGDAPKTVSGN